VDGDEFDHAAALLALADLPIDRASVVFAQEDSGCVSYGVEVGGCRWFVKSARDPAGEASLENALLLHAVIRHPAIVRPLRSFRSGALTLVYPWVEGTVLNQATVSGSDRSALAVFQQLPISTVCAAISTVLDAHVSIAAHGYVAVDLYDGCLLYDFTHEQMHLIDLDEYHQGPFTLAGERLPGSLHYMAPEEFVRGATIDERTNVFTLGRAVQHLLDADKGWRGTAAQMKLVERATAGAPQRRYQTIAGMYAAWRAASLTLLSSRSEVGE